MNKDLIKKFRFESAEHANSIKPLGITKWNEIRDEKFAELVVLECERIAKDPQWYSDRPSDGWRNPINHVCNVMKEKFGVKE